MTPGVYDLIFRAAIWVCVSTSASYIAVDIYGVKPIEHLVRISAILGPLVNSLGVISLALCVLALMLKQLEVTLTDPQLVAATRGCIGGFVRRLAGDLSLWTLGVFTTVLSTLIIVVTRSELTGKENGLAGIIALLLTAYILFIAGLNVLVRRRNAPGLPPATRSVLLLYGH